MAVETRFKAVCKTSKISICNEMKIADGIFDRMIGLMFIDKMDNFDGLLIKPCNQIHTFFMKFDIDLIFLNNKNEIIKIVYNKKPWRMSLLYFRASKVLEIKSGCLNKEILEGEKVEFICIN